jgi:hypothetical protein
MQQQARRFDRSGAEVDGAAALLYVRAFMPIDDGRDTSLRVALEPVDEAVGANLGTGGQRLGDKRDVEAGLRAEDTALMAESAPHARLALGVARLRVALGDGGDRSLARLDPECLVPLAHGQRGCVQRNRRQRIAASGVPRIVGRAGDAKEALDFLVERHQFFICQRKVAAQTGIRPQL